MTRPLSVRRAAADHELWYAWSNFTLTANTGHVREVDLLVIAPTESLECITPEVLIIGTEYHQPNLFVFEEINWYLTRQFGYGKGPK
ncbi:hypothetical protein JMUB6875_15110 [Nocardia sp. JMUB6875]|uniref:hypothetical protein n=1 Tax=Nocardia sp. JMUB6875 TaxID=3158170 RepID=UPI0032E55758